MAEVEPTKKSLWREAIACFWRHRKAWFREAALFMLVVFALNIVAYRDAFLAPPSPTAPTSALTETQMASIKDKNPALASAIEEQMKIQKAMDPGVKKALSMGEKIFESVVRLAGVAASLAMAYIFAVFFLDNELRRGLIRSRSRFSFFVVELIMAGVLDTLCPLVPAFAAFALAQFVLPLQVAIAIGIGVWGILMVYMSMRLSLVGIMASDDVENPIRESWKLTSGNLLRIFGNGVMLTLVTVPLMLVSLGCFAALASFPFVGKLLALAVGSAISVVYAGVFMAFSCATYHILNEETPKPSALSSASIS